MSSTTAYTPAETSARIQQAIAETVRRQVERKNIRADMAAARQVGLARRHQNKLSRMKGRTTVARNSREKPAEVEREIDETETARCFRLADGGFQTAIRNLRKLRTIPAARDALKLTRQAQNLLMDAEDDA
jgi:hypothetical protein